MLELKLAEKTVEELFREVMGTIEDQLKLVHQDGYERGYCAAKREEQVMSDPCVKTLQPDDDLVRTNYSDGSSVLIDKKGLTVNFASGRDYSKFVDMILKQLDMMQVENKCATCKQAESE